MEERLSAPLPLLPINQESLESSSIRSVPSATGPFTTPGRTDDTQTVIQWQAADLLNKIDSEVLVRKIPRLAGSYCEIEQVPIIRSYMNVLLLLQEKDTGKQWVTRIPYKQQDSRFLIDQVEPIIRVRKRFKFGVPYLYHYGFVEDEEFAIGVDYMLLEFMAGRQMLMWTETFPRMEQKNQILEQLTDIYIKMFTTPVTYSDRLQLRNPHNVQGMQADFDAFDIPQSASTSSYLHHMADEAIRGKIQRLLANDAEEKTYQLRTTMEHRYQSLLTLLMMRALVPIQIIGQYNDSSFYITHPDLHNRNIITDGKMAPEKPPQLRSMGTCSTTFKHPLLRQRIRSCSELKRDKIKINGIVDWDKAHPVPLQCAAIYPKFLETLPEAEFPDLPDNYNASDLSHEKKMFLDMLRKKEFDKTGATIVSIMIENGSWERDFFHVALDRGDVRLKWFEWWKREQVKQYGKHPGVADELLLRDVDNIRAGLQAFLARPENMSIVEECRAWSLIARVVHDIEKLEAEAANSCWVPSTPRRLFKKAVPIPRRRTGPHVACKIQEYNRTPSLGADSGSCSIMSLSTPGSKPAWVDNYLKFVLGDELGRVVKAAGEERSEIQL